MDCILYLAQGGGGGLLTMLIPALLFMAVIYLVMIKPQQKREKQRQETLSKTKVGDHVVSVGGIHGTVTNVKDKTFLVKVAEKAVMEFNRGAISRNLDAEQRSGQGGEDEDDADEAKAKGKS